MLLGTLEGTDTDAIELLVCVPVMEAHVHTVWMLELSYMVHEQSLCK